jgi:hypothetical protein
MGVDAWNRYTDLTALYRVLREFKSNMYHRPSEKIGRHDERWEKFFDLLGRYIKEALQTAVAKRISAISQQDGQKRYPICGQCIFWKTPPGGTGKKYENFKMCTHPEAFRLVTTFDATKMTKEEIRKAKDETTFYTTRRHSCRFGCRNTHVKGFKNIADD